MFNFEIIGQKMKRARISKNITQREFADKLGVSVGYISQLESGKKCFNIKRLKEVSKILEKPVSYFIDGADIDANKAMIDEIEGILYRMSKQKINVTMKMMNTENSHKGGAQNVTAEKNPGGVRWVSP